MDVKQLLIIGWHTWKATTLYHPKCGSYRTGFPFILDACGVIVEWFIFRWVICTVLDSFILVQRLIRSFQSYGMRYVVSAGTASKTNLYLTKNTPSSTQICITQLYCQPYGSIKWDSTRHLVADMDNYSPIPSSMKFAQNCLSMYENWFIFRPFRNAARKAGLKFCFEYMQAEDLQTNYIDIGPVNKSLNMVAAYHGTSFCDS